MVPVAAADAKGIFQVLWRKQFAAHHPLTEPRRHRIQLAYQVIDESPASRIVEKFAKVPGHVHHMGREDVLAIRRQG